MSHTTESEHLRDLRVRLQADAAALRAVVEAITRVGQVNEAALEEVADRVEATAQLVAHLEDEDNADERKQV